MDDSPRPETKFRDALAWDPRIDIDPVPRVPDLELDNEVGLRFTGGILHADSAPVELLPKKRVDADLLLIYRIVEHQQCHDGGERGRPGRRRLPPSRACATDLQENE
jgi:hypothetical protein